MIGSSANRAGPYRMQPRAAFTLLELLLALAVFAIVLVAINGVYFAALRLRNKSAEAADRALPLEQTLTLMRRDLSGLMLPGGTFSGTFQTTTMASGSLMESIGRRVTPDLYTATGYIDEWSPYGDVQKVAYFLASPTNQGSGLELIRVASRNLLPVSVEELEPQLLLENVENVMTYYHNGYDWTEVWDSTQSTNLPHAIKVRIQMMPGKDEPVTRREPIELVVPVLVQPSTNTTEQVSGGGS